MGVFIGILYIVGGVVGLVAGVKLYFKATAGKCTSKRRIEGQVAIITGANQGIGYETAKDLARRGAKVILACRNIENAEKAAARIRKATKNSEVVAKQLDVSSLASVRQFCDDILKQESRLDILVNNAGVAGMRKTFTDEGLELHFATNHFGPFLLTNMLLGLMKKNGSGRIVCVSSVAHTWTKELDLENLNSEKQWEPKLLYARTKLANILFIRELARRLKEAGLSGITANAVNPGGVQTAIFRHARKTFKYMIMVSQFFFKTPEEGAQPSIHLCVAEEIEGQTGLYWTDCKLSYLLRTAVTKSSKLAEDMDVAKKLWEKSIQVVKLAEYENHLK